MKIRKFTKLLFVLSLIGAHLGSYSVQADTILLEESNLMTGVTSGYKGGTTGGTAAAKQTAAQTAEKRTVLQVSGHNVRPSMSDIDLINARLLSSAVSDNFKRIESSGVNKSVYNSITLANFTLGRDSKMSPSISAYPNPSRGVTRLSLSQIGNDTYKIKVSNTIGRVVSTMELPATASSEVALDLNLSGLPAGVYFYSLMVNDKTVETKRLVLQK